MADFQRDIDLLTEYSQWKAINHGLGDTSPTAFMVERAQKAAFEKLEKLEEWFKLNVAKLPQAAVDHFTEIMEGTD